MANLTNLTDFIQYLARESEVIIKNHFDNASYSVEHKADKTLVTAADREAEEVMRALIEKHHPEHGIVGEEYGNVRAGAEYVWVLDPIDGTKSFVAGTPQFGTLIALMHKGQPVLGIINHPATKQMLFGDGKTTLLNGRPVRTRATKELKDAIVLTTELSRPQIHHNPQGWNHMIKQVKSLYTWGDCHGYFLLSTGGADIVCDINMKPWDRLALIPVVRGAGGVATDWYGNDPVPGEVVSMVTAATPELHALALKALAYKE